MPVTSPYSENDGSTINGFKIRELFARPNAHDHTFFYAVNFEFSVNHHYWESRTITSEIRPIVGLHLHPWDFIYNPIVDTDYTGGLGNLQTPLRESGIQLQRQVGRCRGRDDGFGPLHGFLPLSKQFHEVWATTDYSGSKFLGLSVETGVGYGLTAASDKWSLS